MRLLLGVAIVACALALVRPAAVHAGYPLVASTRVVRGFGEMYRSADATASSTHRGADLSAAAGDRVLAPFAGHVSFAGRVPAVGGGTVRAVTLQTAEGAITLLPLSRVDVAKGDDVAEGAGVGTLAENGDGSSGESHLHVGVKRGNLYVDPMSLLTLPVAAPSEGAGAGASAPAHASGAAGVSSAHAASSSGAQSARMGAGVTVAVPAAAGVSAGVRAALHSPVPGARLAPGVTVAGATVTRSSFTSLATRAAPTSALGNARTSPAGGAQAPPAAGLTVRELVARVARLVSASARALTLALLGMLAGLGMLWPLWRAAGRKGTGEDRVRGVAEDVAAVVGQ